MILQRKFVEKFEKISRKAVEKRVSAYRDQLNRSNLKCMDNPNCTNILIARKCQTKMESEKRDQTV